MIKVQKVSKKWKQTCLNKKYKFKSQNGTGLGVRRSKRQPWARYPSQMLFWNLMKSFSYVKFNNNVLICCNIRSIWLQMIMLKCTLQELESVSQEDAEKGAHPKNNTTGSKSWHHRTLYSTVPDSVLNSFTKYILTTLNYAFMIKIRRFLYVF